MKLCKDCKRYGKCGRFYSSMSNYAEECKDFDEIKPTNFDRIKAMSVEEMAEFLKRVCIGKEVEWTMGGILRYLESEVQEDD